MKKMVSFIICLLLLTSCNNNNNINENNNNNNPVEVQRPYTMEREDVNTLVYKNTDEIVIDKVDADMSIIKENLSEIRTMEEDKEFNSVLKIEDGKIIFEVTNARELNFSADTVRFVITAIKNPKTFYFYTGISAQDDMDVEFYVKNDLNKIYHVKFEAKLFDGYKISEINEINVESVTKYLVKDGSIEVDIPYVKGIDNSDEFKRIYDNFDIQCGYRKTNDFECKFGDEYSYITYVDNGEAYEAFADYLECDSSSEKCVDGLQENYVVYGLTGFKNVADVNMDLNPDMSRVILIATSDAKLYYYIRYKDYPNNYSLIRVNTPLKFEGFIKNVDISNKGNSRTKTVFRLSDGNAYTISYNEISKTISLDKYTGDIGDISVDDNYEEVQEFTTTGIYNRLSFILDNTFEHRFNNNIFDVGDALEINGDIFKDEAYKLEFAFQFGNVYNYKTLLGEEVTEATGAYWLTKKDYDEVYKRVYGENPNYDSNIYIEDGYFKSAVFTGYTIEDEYRFVEVSNKKDSNGVITSVAKVYDDLYNCLENNNDNTFYCSTHGIEYGRIEIKYTMNNKDYVIKSISLFKKND